MKFTLALVAAAAMASAALPNNAYAIGCVSGAAMGGVAGHVAGHHGVLGAAAGCAVGHHENVKNQRNAAAASQPAPQAPQQ